jgi:hypothetical protein
LRLRATRRLGEMVQAQKESVGLNTGLAGSAVTGLVKNPVMDNARDAPWPKPPHPSTIAKWIL